LQIRVPAPKHEVLTDLLVRIANHEKFELPAKLALNIAI
jgi:hypothetical protein